MRDWNTKMSPIFGSIELHSWIEWLPDGSGRGMSLAIHKDEHGKVTKVVGPEPTGTTLELA